MITIKVNNSQTGESQEKNMMPEILAQGGGLIGRNPKCDLILNSSDVSRVHARIICQSGRYYFSDLGSTSGSLVNGEEAQTNQNFLLKPNDVIRIGDFVLTIKEVKSEDNGSNLVVGITKFLGLVVFVGVLAALAYLYLPLDSFGLNKFFHQ